jgi:hypothetical protein
VRQNVDQAGMRAGGEHDLPLAGYIDRHETLVWHYLVQLPTASRNLALLAEKPAFETGYARDFAAYKKHLLKWLQ